MKVTPKIIALFVIMGGFSGTAFCQQSVSATSSVSATVVSPLAISKVTDLNFGNVSVSGTLGTVILTPQNARSTTGGCQLANGNMGSVSAASFSVTGQDNYAYGITLPASTTLSGGSGLSMSVDTYITNQGTTGTLGTGPQILNVGGTLHLAASQAPGVYTLPAGLLVTVSYN